MTRLSNRKFFNVLWILAFVNLRASVSALKCFVCQSSAAQVDPLMIANNNTLPNKLCSNFNDTSQLKEFAITCPSGTNACYATAPNQESEDSIRSCMHVEQSSLNAIACQDQVLTNTTVHLCTCFKDYCNVYSKTANLFAGIYAGVLKSYQTDRLNLTNGGLFPEDYAEIEKAKTATTSTTTTTTVAGVAASTTQRSTSSSVHGAFSLSQNFALLINLFPIVVLKSLLSRLR